jgi:hypothetical protein
MSSLRQAAPTRDKFRRAGSFLSHADAAQPKNATAKPVSGGSFDDTIPFAPEVR